VKNLISCGLIARGLLGRSLIARGAALGALLCTLVVSRSASADGFEVELEVGAVAASRNDVRIPGAGGTDLSLVDDLSSPTTPVFRARAGYRFAERHLISALYAPLRINATGTLDRDIAFAGQVFPAGSPALAVYRFDSYRLTYRYSFLRNEIVELAGGLTGKIRDAEIRLQGAEVATKTNTGFVPLLNAHFEWRPGAGPVGLLVDVDALAAPQGRAEDVLLAATWRVDEAIELRAGYRMLEGGADNDEVYSFAWLHYATVGVGLQF
jgi:hypothetical protein